MARAINTIARAPGFEGAWMTVVQLRSARNESGRHDELFEIIRNRSFRRGHFKLASGIESDLYFNMKATIMDPRGGYLVALEVLDFAHKCGAEFVGGLALGAVPTLGAVAAISFAEDRPLRTFFVRQEAKAHGTGERIEGLSLGESFEGKTVVVVDDVATKGGSIMQAIEAARELGATIDTALVIVDREKGAEDYLLSKNVKLFSLFQEHQFV
ncbi:MAG TPA: orotate phosphoribosyltransferase [Polyangia bacterium]|nr:orotate phosphoribosyltransferase [Polyangia bacterium]